MKSNLVSTTLIVTVINLISIVCGQYVFTYEVPENRAPQSNLFDVSKYKVNAPSQVPQTNGDISKPSSTFVPPNLPYRPPDERPTLYASGESPPPQPQPQPQPPPLSQQQPLPQLQHQPQSPQPQIRTTTRELTPAEEEEARRSLETLQRYINEQSQLGYLRPRLSDQRDYYRIPNLNPNPFFGPSPNDPFRGSSRGSPYRGPPPNIPYTGPALPQLSPRDIPRLPPQQLPQPLPQPPPYQPSPDSQPPAQEFHLTAPNYNPSLSDHKVIEGRPPQRKPQLSAYNTTTLPPQLSTLQTSTEAPAPPQAPPSTFHSPLLNSFLSQYGSYEHQRQPPPQPQPQPATTPQTSPLAEQQPYMFQPNYGTPAVPIYPESHNNVVLRVIQRRPVNPSPNGAQSYLQPNYTPNQGYSPNVVLRVVQRRPIPQYTQDSQGGPEATGHPKFQSSQEVIRNLREQQLIQQFARMNSPNNTQYGQPSYNQETSVLPGHRFTRLPQTYRQAYTREDPLVKEAYQQRPRQTRPNRLQYPEYSQPQRPQYTPTESPPYTYTPQYTPTERPPQYTYTPQYTQPTRQHYPQDVINRQPSATFETARVPYEPTRSRKEQNYDIPSSTNDFNKSRFKQQLQKNPNPETHISSPQLTTKRPRTTTTFKPAHLKVAALPADDDDDGIPGIAGKDYPNLEKIPKTSFSCAKQPIGGYYADTETACQVVHICQAGGLQSSFLCPNGTIFNQEKFACQWWYEANCGIAPSYYELNDNLYRTADDRNKKSAK